MTVLHKEVYGQGEPVVMLHGWAMHSGVWRVFAQTLATQRQLVCMDLPGHGLSESVSPYTLESVVDAVYAELPEQACTLVGWSLGGNVALRLAEKYPQRIKSIVLIASNPQFTATQSWPGVASQALKEFANNLQRNCTPTLLRFMSLQVQGKPDTKSNLKQIKMAMQECAAPTAEVLEAGLSVLQTVDQTKVLSSIAMPVLMVLGEQDTLVPVSVGKCCQSLNAQIEVKIIAGAGHVPFITDQEQLLMLMQDFMQRSKD
ncbi:MAG: pimeloyl-ACP methyl ester esterase BioH [Methyloprofundus sp.]|nr:pimeloyl-ACP methyl ester esterase BioH [Methyloprofundus sp.]